MPLLHLKYADANDIHYIISTQTLPHVREYISAISQDDIVAGINSSDETYLIGIDTNGNNVAYAHLCGLSLQNQSIELRQLAVSSASGGYGRSFIQLLISEALDKHHANRFWLDVFPQNSRARHVYQQAGFVEEGTLRDHYLWSGRFQSAVIMSILAREYTASA